ncbi:T-cell surface glycoprotein CD3 epsilon chain-like [Polymixia lowei]
MNRIVSGVLAALLLLITTVKADKGSVSFQNKEFKMSCPESGDWYKGETKTKINETTQDLTLKYDDSKGKGSNKGHYYCQYNEYVDATTPTIYQFYVRGKVCDNCYELDGSTLGVAIVLDLTVTGLVILLVYFYAKRKNSAGPTPTKGPAQAAGRDAPPVPPATDYEPLNHLTRGQETYSALNR